MTIILYILVCVVSYTNQLDTISVHTNTDDVCDPENDPLCDTNKETTDSVEVEAQTNGPRFRAKFPFTYTAVPRYHHSDPKVWEAIQNQVPAIIYGRPVFRTDVTWDLAYLGDRLKDNTGEWNVVVNDGPVFLDYDEDANYANYKWKRQYERRRLPFGDFVSMHEELTKANNGTKAYIQSILTDERMGSNTVYRWDESFINTIRERLGWGESAKNLVLLAMPECMTPCHYDFDENLFQQVSGYKRFVMFHPDHFADIYPHPAHHARDRYTMVDFENPDYERFPRFRNLEAQNEAYEAVLSPGDVVYVPSNWWHIAEASSEGDSLSVATRFMPREAAYYNIYDSTLDLMALPKRDGKTEYKRSINVEDPTTGKSWNIQKPDGPIPLIFMRRIIENFIAEATGSYRKVPEMLHEILDGRFDGLEFSNEDPL